MECCFDGVGWRLFNDVSTRMVGLVVLALAYSDCWLRVWRLLAYSVYYGGVIEEPLIMSQQGWLFWWFEIYLLYSDCAGCGNGLCCFGGLKSTYYILTVLGVGVDCVVLEVWNLLTIFWLCWVWEWTVLFWWFEIYLLYSDCAGCGNGLCCFGGLKSTYYILTVLGVGMDCVVLVVWNLLTIFWLCWVWEWTVLFWWFEIYLLYSDCAGCGNGLCCFGGLKSTYYILTVLGVGMDCVVLVVWNLLTIFWLCWVWEWTVLFWWFEIYLLYSDCAGCGNGLCCFGGLKSTYYILTVLGVGMDCVVLVVWNLLTIFWLCWVWEWTVLFWWCRLTHLRLWILLIHCWRRWWRTMRTLYSHLL